MLRKVISAEMLLVESNDNLALHDDVGVVGCRTWFVRAKADADNNKAGGRGGIQVEVY